MTVRQTSSTVSINLFKASKQIRFLESLKRLRFSGQLILTGSTGQQWIFFLTLGRLIYATGGDHPVRRFRRNLAACCPQMPNHSSELHKALANVEASAIATCWDYYLLNLWVEQGKIGADQATKIVGSAIAEVLFDVAQAPGTTYRIQPDRSLSTSLISIDVQQAIAQVNKYWEAWRAAEVAKYSPNQAPIITQPEPLKQATSEQLYAILSKILSGQMTLRDLAVQMKRDPLQVTCSLLPYLQAGWVQLVTIPDLPTPIAPPKADLPTSKHAPAKPLIACVDDSPTVCHTMEALLGAAGYRFVAVQDGLRAIATLLAKKPDAIFLDLVMPNTNGYEICAKLRKISHFQETPIIILTGNDGVIDQIRAKIVGASDFLSKPVDAEAVLGVIHKYLEQEASCQ
jgi:chemotaxis family two-component system response regulator PixG